MNSIIWFVIGLVIGYLDPIIIFRKFNSLMEKSIFPFMSELRDKWRQKPVDVKMDEYPISAVTPDESDETNPQQ
jgi:hypothetical protein